MRCSDVMHYVLMQLLADLADRKQAAHPVATAILEVFDYQYMPAFQLIQGFDNVPDAGFIYGHEG